MSGVVVAVEATTSGAGQRASRSLGSRPIVGAPVTSPVGFPIEFTSCKPPASASGFEAVGKTKHARALGAPPVVGTPVDGAFVESLRDVSRAEHAVESSASWLDTAWHRVFGSKDSKDIATRANFRSQDEQRLLGSMVRTTVDEAYPCVGFVSRATDDNYGLSLAQCKLVDGACPLRVVSDSECKSTPFDVSQLSHKKLKSLLLT